MPALRERSEDIPLLAKYFLKIAANELNVEAKTLSPETEAYISRLSWPGNVRQIENTCRWLTVMSAGQVINVEDLPPELQEDKAEQTSNGDWLEVLRRWVERQLAQGDTAILEQATPQFERVMIETALKKSGGRRQDAAKLLGWGRNTLTRKIKELGMEAQV